MPAPASIRALSLDAGGALLHPRESVAATYSRVARAHGGQRTVPEVDKAFREAMSRNSPGQRYVGDGRPYWRDVVRIATGVEDDACFEVLYRHYASAAAWCIAPGAVPALDRWRTAGGRVAVVSDWDDRLRPLLSELGLDDLLDTTIISAEVGVEKPDPAIFLAAVEELNVSPSQVVHLGDSPRRDVEGARAVGMHAMEWTGFAPLLSHVVETLLSGSMPTHRR
ncbi:MAG: HAD-IA family hydrolase [Myxococcota bacterium]|nr:HAD-IA family hydrolase [Myxococcota bacterium]